MKAKFNVGSNLQLEIEAADQKTLFAEMARHQEIFGHTKCGACGSSDIRPVVRHVTVGKKEYDYYELHCQNPSCRCRLAFGVNNGPDGTLFPKKKDKAGEYLKNNGWVKYQPNQDETGE